MSGSVTLKVIGTIRSEHVVPGDTPIQPCFAKDCQGRVEVLPEFEEGLESLEGFSHLILSYYFHRAASMSLTVTPFLQDEKHGVFATRHPRRPNAVGLSTVRLLRREGVTLFVSGVDILDGTPLLDIKPYSNFYDRIETTRNGWLDAVDEADAARRGRRGYRSSEITRSGE